MQILLSFLVTVLLIHPALAQSESPKGSDLSSALMREIDETESKVLNLADAMPAEMYAWRPSDDVRSVSEVFAHIADANYYMPTLAGFAAPDWFQPGKLEETKTSKEDVIEALKLSFEHLREALRATKDNDWETQTRWFGGGTNTVRGVWIFVPKHLGEHQGQLIAYARMNDVVPPWSR